MSKNERKRMDVFMRLQKREWMSENEWATMNVWQDIRFEERGINMSKWISKNEGERKNLCAQKQK